MRFKASSRFSSDMGWPWRVRPERMILRVHLFLSNMRGTKLSTMRAAVRAISNAPDVCKDGGQYLNETAEIGACLKKSSKDRDKRCWALSARRRVKMCVRGWEEVEISYSWSLCCGSQKRARARWEPEPLGTSGKTDGGQDGREDSAGHCTLWRRREEYLAQTYQQRNVGTGSINIPMTRTMFTIRSLHRYERRLVVQPSLHLLALGQSS